MTVEPFAAGTSFVHRLDPRVKIVSALCLAMVTAAGNRLGILGLALLVGLVLVSLARLRPLPVAGRLLGVNVFLLLLWCILPFSYPGRPLLTLGPLTASYEGVRYAFTITLKSNAIILAMIALLATTPTFSLVHGLWHMRMPVKLVQLLFFTFRYFHVMHQEYLRLRGAMRVRCFKARTNGHTYRSLAYLVGMLLVRSFDRSERIYQAMLCRGFQGRFWVLNHFTLRAVDLVFLGVMVLVALGMAAGHWTNLIG